MNQIANRNTNAQLPAELAALGTAMIQESTPVGGLGIDLLKFLSREGGIWVYGREETESDPDSTWAINPLSIQHGYVCWKDSKIAGEEMVPVGTPKPVQTSLVDHGEDAKGKQTKWDMQMSFSLVCTDGPDEGAEVVFKTSTVGGVNCIKGICKEMGQRINAGSVTIVPLCALANDSYNHSEYGKTYVPVIEIVDWTSMDDPKTNAPAAEAEAPEPEAVPTDPEPEKNQEEAAPTSRRRRRSSRK